jgi:hypothetical protein
MTHRPKIVIDGRKDAEWLHGGRNWFVADPPRPELPPPEALRNAAISYWVGFSIFASIVIAVVVLIAWIAG